MTPFLRPLEQASSPSGYAPADKQSMANPLGRKLESHTKTLMEGGSCLESITLLPYREGLGLGGCFFPFFFAPKK